MMENMEALPPACPRCGAELKHGFTSSHKICWDCPGCGGRLVTLPVLKDGLDEKGVATLARKAREATQSGCRCPTCDGVMGLIKVEIDGCKIEIDVCGKCLSVWCDRGEFEMLVPKSTTAKVKPPSLKELAERASPAARERLARIMLEDLPESVDPMDVSLGDVVRDLLGLVFGGPEAWRTMRPASPAIATLLTLALPIGQFLAYWAWHGEGNIGGYRGRRYWGLDESMAAAGGFDFSSPLSSLVTHPFLQTSGNAALGLAFVLFPVFTLIERKSGHAQFLKLLGALWATSVVAHALQLVVQTAPHAYLCGIGPIAFGCLAYLHVAWPNLRFQWCPECNLADIYLGLAALWVLVGFLFVHLQIQTVALAVLALVGCGVVGAWLGRRQARRDAEEKMGDVGTMEKCRKRMEDGQ